VVGKYEPNWTIVDSSHHSVFPKIPLFWSLEFGPIHPPNGMRLCMMLASVRLALRRRVSGSIPFMMTQVGYLGKRGFKLIIQCPKLIPLYCHDSVLDLPTVTVNRGLDWRRQSFNPPLMCRKRVADCSLRVVSVCTYTSIMSAKRLLLPIHGK
jgi:hypothetical protein